MATKSFYKDMESGSGSVKISRLYKASLHSVDGTSIPPGSTVTNLTVKLWMSRKNGVSSNMHFYYLADYDECNNKSSSNKYYYIGSCKNHHNNSSTEALKAMRRLSSSNASNYSTTSHNYEVSFSASELSTLNKAFIAERCIGVTSISGTQIRASSVEPTKYNTDTHSCHAI